MTMAEQREKDRQDMAINAVADALLSVCALQTGDAPLPAYRRAVGALLAIMQYGADEQYGAGSAMVVPTAGGCRIEHVGAQS